MPSLSKVSIKVGDEGLYKMEIIIICIDLGLLLGFIFLFAIDLGFLLSFILGFIFLCSG